MSAVDIHRAVVCRQRQIIGMNAEQLAGEAVRTSTVHAHARANHIAHLTLRHGKFPFPLNMNAKPLHLKRLLFADEPFYQNGPGDLSDRLPTSYSFTPWSCSNTICVTPGNELVVNLYFYDSAG